MHTLTLRGISRAQRHSVFCRFKSRYSFVAVTVRKHENRVLHLIFRLKSYYNSSEFFVLFTANTSYKLNELRTRQTAPCPSTPLCYCNKILLAPNEKQSVRIPTNNYKSFHIDQTRCLKALVGRSFIRCRTKTTVLKSHLYRIVKYVKRY